MQFQVEVSHLRIQLNYFGFRIPYFDFRFLLLQFHVNVLFSHFAVLKLTLSSFNLIFLLLPVSHFPHAASDFPAAKFRFRHPWNHKWIVKYLILNLENLYLKLRDFNEFANVFEAGEYEHEAAQCIFT